MTPMGTGIKLGILNTIVIAFGLGAAFGDPVGEVVPAVVLIGLLPAVLLGAAVGAIAGRLAAHPAQVRLPVLAVMPIVFVLAVGTMLDIFDAAALACIPTAVAVLHLERTTRRRVAPLVPVARVS